jgi:hypothetical protein
MPAEQREPDPDRNPAPRAMPRDYPEQRVDRQRQRGRGQAAGSTSAQFCVCSPAKIMSPRLGWPTVVDSVAAPIVHTAAVRMPAISTGAPVAPRPVAASAMRHADAVGRLDHRRIDARSVR